MEKIVSESCVKKFKQWQAAWALLSGHAAGLPEASAWLPAAGLTAGLALWLAATILLHLFPASAAGLLSAVLLPAWLWWLTAGRGLRGVIDVVERGQAGKPGAQSRYAPYWNILALQGLVLLKAGAVGWLVGAGHPLWLTLPPVLSAAAFADYLTGSNAPGQSDSGASHWLSAAVMALLLGHLCGSVIAAGLALLLAWLLIPFVSGWLKGRKGSLDTSSRYVMLEVVEVATLLIGVLFLAG